MGGAALDVYEKEPPGEATRKLLAHPNVVCTPHLGASTEEAQINVARDIAVQMCDTLTGKDFVGIVNVSYMAMAQNPAAKPFADLADLLGRVASQFAGGKPKSMTLSTWGSGEISITTAAAKQLLQATALKGLLSGMDTKGVVPGLVNAPFLAKELGVESEVLDRPPLLASIASPYRNLIAVEVIADSGLKTKVTGSVFGNEPCLVSLDSYKNFPALKLEGGSVLKYRNKDQPGAMSGVLNVLEEYKVNVGNLTLGRQGSNQDEDLALCLLTVDGQVPAEALDKLEALGNVHEVRTATL